jgi:predicted metalloprotease with PDZ domain
MRIASSHLVAGLLMGLLLTGCAMADQSRIQGPYGHGRDNRVSTGVVGISLVIGAERIGDPAGLYVGMVHPDGPAYKAGLRHGDEVRSVEGISVTGKTYEQVANMIRGEVGTIVKMQVTDEKGIHELAVERVAGNKLKHPAESQDRPE